jgi:hypothetical protein
MAPVNIASQNTIDETGCIITKDRLTHDQSFKWGSGTSVNSRVNLHSLLPCPFGQALRCHFTAIIDTRRKYPGHQIFVSKIDYKSAFQRMHLSWITALRSCTQLSEDGIALLALRLTFGGRPCPSDWGSVSETVHDLANALMSDPNWDPDELFNPQSLEIPKIISLPNDVEIAKAKELVISVPATDKGSANVFIDDTFAHTLDLPNSGTSKGLREASFSLYMPLHLDVVVSDQQYQLQQYKNQ